MTDVAAVEGLSQPARLARIREHREEFEAAGERSETLRHLPPETADTLRELGIFWLKTPRSLGGEPLDPLEFCDVIEELGYLDAAVAWAAMIGAGTTGLAGGWLSDAGAAAVFAPEHDLPVIAGQPGQPRGRGRQVDGGWTVTGRWGFASGIAHATWVTGAFIPEGDSGPARAFVIPKEQVEVIDTWDVAGLRGTGSFDFALQDVFLREEWIYDPTSPAVRDVPLHAQHYKAFLSNEVPPLAIGVARRALDCITGLSRETTRLVGAGPLSERASFQKELGRAAARIRGARALHRDAVANAAEATTSGDAQDAELAVLELLTASVLTVETCSEVVVDLFRYGGGRALSLGHPMQRYLRDLLAARQHVSLSEEQYELGGRYLIESYESRVGAAAAPTPRPAPAPAARLDQWRASPDDGRGAAESAGQK